MLRKTYLLITLLALCLNSQGQINLTHNGNTTPYSTLSEAILAANGMEGATLSLQDDVAYDETQTLPKITSDVTLNLNGHELWSCANRLLTVNGSNARLTINDSSHDNSGVIYHQCDADSYTINISNGGTVTMNSGTVRCTYLYNSKVNTNCAIYIDTTGKLLMNGGTIESTSNNNVYCVGLSGKNTSLEMNGGRMLSRSLNKDCHCIYDSYGNVNISGGELSADCVTTGECLYLSNGKLNISGGRFKTKGFYGSVNDLSISSAKTNVTITGGLFSKYHIVKDYVSQGFYLTPLAHDTREYNEGYVVTISNEPYKTDGVAWIQNRKQYYNTLEQAMASALQGDTIVLMQDYTLKQNLTIPKGVMLLLPYDIIYSCNTVLPQSMKNYVSPKVYRTLTVADGVVINIEGEMSIGANLMSAAGGQFYGTGAMNESYALMMLGNDARVNVNGKLYCWGYIGGKGSVTMLNGSVLYESFVITDWRGGTRSSDLYLSNNMFPFHQYYIQNVEVPVTFHYGSQNLLGTDMQFQGNSHIITNIKYITSGKEGLYQLSPGSRITRTYNGADDRIAYDLYGNIAMGSINIEYDGMDIDSKNFVLHISNNVTINHHSGTLTMPHRYALAAGAELRIDEPATLVLKDKCRIYVYDRRDWQWYSGKGYVLPLIHTAANGSNNRAIRWADNNDAMSEKAYEKISNSIIDVRGTMHIDNASILYSTTMDYKTEELTDTLFQVENLNTTIIKIPFVAKSINMGKLLGDVDGNGFITMSDANMVVNYYLTNDAPSALFRKENADVDGDGKITMSDANMIVNKFLNSLE